jgi:hypothetical protein
MAKGNTNFGNDAGTGTVGADGFLGPLTGNVTGNVTGSVTGSVTSTNVTASGSLNAAGNLILKGATVAAAGATHGNATAIPNTAVWINVTTTASTEGVKFVALVTGRSQILKAPTTKGFKVYATGAKIDGTATNTALLIASNKAVLFWCSSTTQLFTLKSA